MVEESKPWEVKHTSKEIKLNGAPISEGATLAPGRVEVTEAFQKANGTPVVHTQTFNLDKSFFEEDKLEIVFTKQPPSIAKPGVQFTVEFQVMKGYAEEFDIFFSSDGKDSKDGSKKWTKVVSVNYDPEKPMTFDFTPDPGLESETCILGIAPKIGKEYVKEGNVSSEVFAVKEIEEPVTPVDEDIKRIIDAISSKDLYKPRRPGAFRKGTSAGTFFYSIITKVALGNYFMLANRLRDLSGELNKPNVREKITDKNFNDYMTKLERLEQIRKQLSGLENPKEVKNRFVSILDELLKIMKSEKTSMKPELYKLMKNFERIHSVDIKRLTGSVFVRNEGYLSWFIEHGAELDTILEEKGLMFSIVGFRNSLIQMLDKTVEMYSQLSITKNVLIKIRKDLKKF